MTASSSSSFPAPLLAPGPGALGSVGYGLGFVRDPFGVLHGAPEKFGPIVRFGKGARCVHLIHHPRHVQRVLIDNNRNYEKSSPFGMMKVLFGRGLLFNEGPSWFAQRRLMQPSFGSKGIAGVSAGIANAISEVVETWPTQEARTVDLEDEMTILARRIIGQLLFSSPMSPEYVAILESVGSKLNFFLGQLPHTPQNRGYHALNSRADAAVYALIAERRASTQESSDMLGFLMDTRDKDSGEGMDDTQVRDEIVTLLFAGFDTTSRTLSWVFHALSHNPKIEADFHAEIDRVLQDHTPTLADLPNLPLTTMIIKETMRLFPANPIIGRRAKSDDTIDGFHIPAGSFLTISPYLAQRSPELWENPLQFDPQRFSPENEKKIDKFAYYPFGGGPRQCIGKGLAMMTIPLALATIAQRYRFAATPGFKVKGDIKVTFQSKHGVPATRHPRM